MLSRRRPVERHAHALERGRLLLDVGVGPLLRGNATLDGRVLRRQPERVPADRMQHVVAAHRLVAGHRVAAAERLGMAHVQVTRRVREHVERVEPRTGIVGVLGGPVQALVGPHLLPLRLDLSCVVPPGHARNGNERALRNRRRRKRAGPSGCRVAPGSPPPTGTWTRERRPPARDRVGPSGARSPGRSSTHRTHSAWRSRTRRRVDPSLSPEPEPRRRARSADWRGTPRSAPMMSRRVRAACARRGRGSFCGPSPDRSPRDQRSEAKSGGMSPPSRVTRSGISSAGTGRAK